MNPSISTGRPLSRFYPWLVWLLAASFFFYKYVLQVSPSVMSGDLMRAFGIGGAGLGNLAASFFYAYLLMQIPVGLLLDRFSPRLLTTIAVLVCASGTFLFSHAHNLEVAIASRFMIGLGAAFAAVSCFKLTTLWFAPKHFAMIAGLSMTAAMLGAIGGQAPLSYLVVNYGWRDALELVAIPGFALAVLFAVLVRDRRAPILLPTPKAPKITLRAQLRNIMCDKQTWLLSFYSGLAFAPVSVFGGLWGTSFIETAYHLGPVDAAGAVSLIFVGFAIGCPISGWYSDYIGRRNPLMLAGTIIALVSLICVFYLPLNSVLYLRAMLLLFGLGASCFFLCFSMVREIHALVFAATVLGFMNTFDSICEAVTEPFIGKLLDLTWNGQYQNGIRLFTPHDYRLGLSALVIYYAIALVLLFFIKETHCKQKH